jgi:cell fate regulator YaaT (PSP1 superfamily)
MTVVVGIRFKDSGKIYYFDPRHLELQTGEQVIVETVRGFELAKVAYERREIAESEVVGELKPVVRRAEAADFERMHLLHARHPEVLERCVEKVHEHALPMNVIKAEYSFDGSRLTFYFTAEKRVDFRQLVRDLARTFKSRIELRQIGPRDEAKLLGGIGPCGRLLCCATFLPDYARVSIKMAKDQDLPLNPAKISGVCGRLLCCLSYEHEQYLEMRGELPRRGTWVQTPDGPGEVTSVNVLKQSLQIKLASSGMEVEYLHAQVEETTARVAETARQRNQEGVTPAARQRRDRGEKRLLRDEIEQSDVLSALALLEEYEASHQSQPDDDEAPPADAPARSARRKRNRGRGGNQAREREAGSQSPSSSSKSESKRSAGGNTGSAPEASAGDQSGSQSSQSRPRRRKRRNKSEE